MSSEEFQVSGRNAAAPFTLKVHRGDGMSVVAMNWKDEEPPQDFVGFAIEYKEPDGDEFFPLKNRLNFSGPEREVNPDRLPTTLSPSKNFVGCTSRATPISPANSSTRSHRSS